MDRPVSTLLFLVLSAVAVASAAAATVVDPEGYWHQQLPNTPIPGAIRTLLCPDLLREVRDAHVKAARGQRHHAARSSPAQTEPSVPSLQHFWSYDKDYPGNESQARNDPEGALAFLEKDLHPNTRKRLQFIRSAPPAPFIPRPVAGAIPFSSKKLPELMARFSLRPNSAGAEDMRVSLHRCEHHAGDESCVTSLESMVDFATANLGGTRDVRASSTEEVGGGGELEQSKQQYYTVAGPVESLQEGSKAVICHAQPFPYAVFFCHAEDGGTRAYKVPLVGEDGSKVTAVAVCHIDTSAWNPRNLAFLVLKVRPGTTICHFLGQDTVVWAPTTWAPTM